MKLHHPRTIGVIASSLLLISCSSTGVQPVGKNSFIVSKQTATGYQTAVGITADVIQEATEYCAASDKYPVIHNVRSRDGVPGQSYATVNLTFGCYDQDDPVYIAANPEPSADVVVEDNKDIKITIDTDERPDTSDDLYDELLKLEDLRQRGILTDEEFAAQKRELLERKR